MMLECPRCRRVLTAFNGEPDAECNCHLYCTQGDSPKDCSVTWPYEWSGELKYPLGLQTNPPNRGAEKYRAMGYCSTHDEYYYKDKIVVELDWGAYFSKRAPKRLRASLGSF